MRTKAKVQTNEYDNNILVETETSTNTHLSSLDKDVVITNVLSDEEILELWKLREQTDELKMAKNWIKKQNGYAVSGCHDKTLNIKYSSIVKYEIL